MVLGHFILHRRCISKSSRIVSHKILLCFCYYFSMLVEAYELVARHGQRAEQTILKSFEEEMEELDGSVFANLIFDIARNGGSGIINQRHILGAIVHDPNPSIVSLFPQGTEDIKNIRELLTGDTEDKVEPWDGEISLQCRTIAIFERARHRANENYQNVPGPVDYLAALILEEYKGSTDVTDLFMSLDINPTYLLHRIDTICCYVN